MTSALEVARYLIHLAAPSEDEDADYLGHMRLHKLLYYVQGWYLAALGKPLFLERIEAWRFGPVVKDLYPHFCEFSKCIPPSEGYESPSLSVKQKAFIRSVWDEYKKYSATALSEMTHRELPWREARGDLGPSDQCSAEIHLDSIRDYFAPRLVGLLAKKDPRINRSAWRESAEAIHSARVKTTQEIRRELRSGRSRPEARGDSGLGNVD